MTISIPPIDRPDVKMPDLAAYRCGAIHTRLEFTFLRLVEQIYPPSLALAPSAVELDAAVERAMRDIAPIQHEMTAAIPLMGNLLANASWADAKLLGEIHQELLTLVSNLDRLPEEIRYYPDRTPRLAQDDSFISSFTEQIFEIETECQTREACHAQVNSLKARAALELVDFHLRRFSIWYEDLLKRSGFNSPYPWYHLGQTLERISVAQCIRSRNQSLPAWNPALVQFNSAEVQQLVEQLKQFGFHPLPDRNSLQRDSTRQSLVDLHLVMLAQQLEFVTSGERKTDEVVSGHFGLHLNCSRRELSRPDYSSNRISIPQRDLAIVRFFVERQKIVAHDALAYEAEYRLAKESKVEVSGSNNAFSPTMKGVFNRLARKYFKPLGLRLDSKRGERSLVEIKDN
jgi:hypothetical protein